MTKVFLQKFSELEERLDDLERFKIEAEEKIRLLEDGQERRYRKNVTNGRDVNDDVTNGRNVCNSATQSAVSSSSDEVPRNGVLNDVTRCDASSSIELLIRNDSVTSSAQFKSRLKQTLVVI